MPDIVAQLPPTEYDFASYFEGDDFVWERFLKHVDEDGVQTPVPMAGYEGSFEVVDSAGAQVFKIDTSTVGYPSVDGVILGAADGQVLLYAQNMAGAGEHDYTLKMKVADTNTTEVSVLFGKFTILEKIST